MTWRVLVACLALLAVGASLPLGWARLHKAELCAPDDAACLMRKAAELLDINGPDGTGFHHGADSYERRQVALARLAAFGRLTAQAPARLEELEAALIDGTLPEGTQDRRSAFITRALAELRVADPATSRAALDLFEAHADVVRRYSVVAFEDTLFWLAVNDMDRLARLLRPEDLERSGGQHESRAEFLRASLLTHECQRLRETGQAPDATLEARLKAAALQPSAVDARTMLTLDVTLSCEGEAAGQAVIEGALAWINPSNEALRQNLLFPQEGWDAQDVVEQVAWDSFLLRFPLVQWWLAQGRPDQAEAAFDALATRRLAEPLAAIDPRIPALFDRPDLTWRALIDLMGRNRLYIAPADVALSYVAAEFEPSFRTDTRDRVDVGQALDLVAAAWPSAPAQAALWRLGLGAINASDTEALRLSTLLRLATLDRSMGCDLPEDLMVEARDRVEGIGFGGGVMTRLERAELALAAVDALRLQQPPALEPGYTCIYPQLSPLWQYQPEGAERLYTRSLPIRD